MAANEDATKLQSNFFDFEISFWISTMNTFIPVAQIILSCANEEANPTVSREYHLLRRIIDIDQNFVEVTALGEELAMNVIKWVVVLEFYEF